MLRATENLTWLATLDKFSRGFEDTEAVPGGCSASSGGRGNVAWTHFSGQNISCKVLFTQPSNKQWPMQSAREKDGDLAMVQQPTVDRQLRIIVECGSTERKQPDAAFNHSGSTVQGSVGEAAALRPSCLLQRGHMLLEDVDLVRVNKAYFHTSRRLDAVEAFHSGLHVGIRYLDEQLASRVHRMQLTFAKEEDKNSFLSLIVSDCSMRRSAAPLGKQPAQLDPQAEKQNKTEGEAAKQVRQSKAEASKVTADLAAPEEQSQTLLDRLIQLAEARIRQTQTDPQTCNHTPLPPDASQKNASTSADALGLLHEFGKNEQLGSSQSSSCDVLASIDGQQLGGAFTESMESDECQFTDDEGLYGWPSSSAVMCIRDDVCWFCLADSNLERIIAQSVDQHLQDLTTASRSEY